MGPLVELWTSKITPQQSAKFKRIQLVHFFKTNEVLAKVFIFVSTAFFMVKLPNKLQKICFSLKKHIWTNSRPIKVPISINHRNTVLGYFGSDENSLRTGLVFEAQKWMILEPNMLNLWPSWQFMIELITISKK
jgi:hypothetical protein